MASRKSRWADHLSRSHHPLYCLKLTNWLNAAKNMKSMAVDQHLPHEKNVLLCFACCYSTTEMLYPLHIGNDQVYCTIIWPHCKSANLPPRPPRPRLIYPWEIKAMYWKKSITETVKTLHVNVRTVSPISFFDCVPWSVRCLAGFYIPTF